MKTLLLTRHAKSDWSNTQLPDHERPLNGRGRRNCPTVASYLSTLRCIPELIVSSTAQRAKQTATLMQECFNPRPTLLLNENLYHAGFGEIQACLSLLSERIQIVMLVGHNPGWEVSASRMSGVSIGMTTANVAILTHPASDWSGAFQPGSWTLSEHVQPKKL